MILPNLIIAGVNKAGTTSLFTYLTKHPQVSGSDIKETCFFLPLRYNQPLKPIQAYSEHFKQHSNQKYIIESTPGYFYGSQKLAQGIHDHLGKIKIVLIFRDPIQRMFSFYNHIQSKMWFKDEVDFDRYVEIACQKLKKGEVNDEDFYLRGLVEGFYLDHLKSWHEIFGDSVKIVFFEQMVEDTLGCVRDLCHWMGIDPGFYKESHFTIENKTVHYKNQLLHKAALGFYHRNEAFFRRFYPLKNMLRAAYYHFNQSTKKIDGFSETTLRVLEEIYQDPNRHLAEFLKTKGYQSMPPWLATEGS